MAGNLYLIPTPIGNLKDISSRIVEAINNCDYLACEDTRNTNKLLNLIGLSKPLISCHQHSELQESPKIINDILSGKTVGYLSDAGFPCISDPGSYLVKEAIKNNINIIPISGPNAALLALIASGLDTTHFLFYGFLKAKSEDRKKELNSLKNFDSTIIFYEAPHRIYEMLDDLYTIFGNRNISISRELTKLHEEHIRTTLKDILQSKRELIGEMVIVVEGNQIKDEETISNSLIEEKLKLLLDNQVPSKEAITSVSLLLNINKNIVKKVYYNLKK